MPGDASSCTMTACSRGAPRIAELIGWMVRSELGTQSVKSPETTPIVLPRSGPTPIVGKVGMPIEGGRTGEFGGPTGGVFTGLPGVTGGLTGLGMTTDV